MSNKWYMKKRRLIAMILAVVLAASPGNYTVLAADSTDDSAETYAVPTELNWDTTNPGAFSFKINEESSAYYELLLYYTPEGSDKEFEKAYFKYGDLSNDASDNIIKGDCFQEIYGSGKYRFRVRIAKNDSKEETGQYSEYSGYLSYTRDNKTTLDTPAELQWDTNETATATWKTVQNADGYMVLLYDEDEFVAGYEVTNKTLEGYIEYSGYNVSDEGIASFDFERNVADSDTLEYTFTVQAITFDLNKYVHSTVSAKSGLLSHSTVIENNETVLEAAASKVTSETAVDVVSELKDDYADSAAKEALRESIQASAEAQNSVQKIEEAYNTAKNIRVEKTSGLDSISANDVSIIGAGFATGNTDSTITLNVGKPGDYEVKDSVYTNIVAFDMSLVETDSAGQTVDNNKLHELDIPVTITLPVPDGMDVALLKILHFKSDGSMEVITPAVIKDGKFVKFTITSFSTFAFAEKTETTVSEEEDTGNKNTGGGSYGGTASGGGSSSGEATDTVSEVNDSNPDAEDPSSVEKNTTTNSDGSVTVTTVRKNSDGSTKTVETTTAKDGSVEKLSLTVSADGSIGLTKTNTSGSTKTTEKYTSAGKNLNVTLSKLTTDAKSVSIPATVKVNGTSYKVTKIAANAFKNNKKITKIIIGKNITKIGKNAFSGDSNLKTVIIKSTSISSIGKNAFKNVKKTATIRISGTASQRAKLKKLIQKSGIAKTVKIKKA